MRTALEHAGLAADVMAVPSVMGGGSVDQALEPYDLVVAAGGDGTVSTIAAAAARTGKVFGVIPCGTLNHFARDTGIPLDLGEAARVLAAGHTRALDIGVVNDHVFINNASVGAYPRLVWERSRARERGLPRPIAMTLAVTRTWLNLRSVTARLCVDNREFVRRTPFIFIGNSEYEVTGTDIGKRMTMTDGKLSLYMAPRFGRGHALLLPFHVLFGTLERHERFEAMQAASIVIDMPRPRVSVALDGELRMLESPLRFSIHHGALTTVVPAGA